MTRERYTLLGLLGSGNFGDVHLARHDGLQRECALKLIRVRTTVADALAEARQITAVPEHENIVKVSDAGVWEDDLVYIASEVCSGGSLEELSEGSGLDPVTACRMISDSCRGLGHLHQHGLLHLDLRPANILLDDRSHPRLVDFGLARWAGSARVHNWYGPHAAPELVERGEATEATDIYAMGMTLAHVLTGGSICRPYPEGGDLVRASSDGSWPRVEELGNHVPPRLRKLITQATSYDPARRPQDVATFKRLLDRATPAVAFAPSADDVLTSTDGSWTIDYGQHHDVVVRKNGRRRGAESLECADRTDAAKHVAKLVKRFAESRS